VTATTLPDGRTLEPGDEFTARRLGRKLRLRFSHASVGPSGVISLTGYDGIHTRSVRADSVETIHRLHKVGKGTSAPPPARRRGR
jgi:hypothetical protein